MGVETRGAREPHAALLTGAAISPKAFPGLADLRGDDDEDTRLLQAMAGEAREYLEQFEWCPPITDMELAYGIGGVLALFRVDFSRVIEGSPDKVLWVVIGDLPSAYFVHEGIETPRAALEAYCGLMEDWAQAVKKGQDLDEEFPVDAKASAENADDLLSRLAFIRSELLPGID